MRGKRRTRRKRTGRIRDTKNEQRQEEEEKETNIETARSTYSNGILEIIFDKQSKPSGTEIKVD